MSTLSKCVVSLIALFFFVNSYGQQHTSASLTVAQNSESVFAYKKVQENATPALIDIKAEYPKIQKLFIKLYPQGTGEHWSETAASLFVTFMNNGNKATASFSKEGVLNYAITQYTADLLPVNLQRHIQNYYTAFKVFNAIEINAYNKIAYQVILENAGSFVTLKSTIDGIEVSGTVEKK